MRRRALLAALAACAACDGCERPSSTSAPSPAPTTSFRGSWRELRFTPTPAYDDEQMAAVLVATSSPVLVAIHGRGEAGRGLAVGARGWRDDYELDRAQARCKAPPLTVKDFHGFVAPERLDQLNASLAAQPYQGLNVACPYTPALADRSVAGAAPFGRFVTEVLLPRVRREVAALSTRDDTGIDGVSMGGRLALVVGLSHPDVFGAVGALQPAIAEREADALADLAARAEPRPSLRLVSSDGDPFLGAVRALSKALTARNVAHQLVVTPGPHDYVWNKGPGSYEMLLWHERVLRGAPAP